MPALSNDGVQRQRGTYNVSGYPVVGLAALASSAGAPLPMMPILLVAGSLAAVESLNLIVLMLIVMICSVVGDSLDYILGRRVGEVLGVLLGLGYTVGTDWQVIWNDIDGVPGIIVFAILGIILIVVGLNWLGQVRKGSAPRRTSR
jgi:membrane protein DedA with SNARE-associated domain